MPNSDPDRGGKGMRCPGPLALLTAGWGTIRRRAKCKLNQHSRLVYLIEIKSAAIPQFQSNIRHVVTGANYVPPASVFVSQRNSIHSVVIDMLNAILGLHVPPIQIETRL